MCNLKTRRSPFLAHGQLLLLLISVFPLSGQQPSSETLATGRVKKMIIGPDDTINVSALNCEEISKSWRVSTSGELNLPLVGRIQAAGLTVAQLEQELTARLAKYILVPQVSVFVTEYRSQPVIVTGAVARPGTIQLEGAKTLFEVLVMAGGPKDAGDTVTIQRGKEHGELSLPGTKTDKDNTFSFADVNLKEVMTGRGNLADIVVEPDDVITVAPIQPARFVHISGEVNHAGSVELVSQDSVSLMKVLAVAGGLTPNAKPSKTMIMHINPSGVQTSTSFIDLGKITSGRAKDLELTVGDVVVVPSSGIKSVLHTATASAITSGVYTGVYILGKF